MGATRRTWSSLLWTRGTVKTVTATTVELSRAAEFQWNSRARGTERSLKECAAETSAARDPRTSHQGTELCDKRTQRGQRRTSKTSAGRARPVARATGRARPARDERRPARSETSGASHRTSETSAGRAETSRRSETSGASCRTSQEPAVPRDECGQKRISHLGRRPRDERAWREPSFG